MTSLIPGNAPTLVEGVPVQTTNYSSTQTGTRPTPRTQKGSGVYGKGIVPTTPAPVRDYVVILRNPTDYQFKMRYLTVEYIIAANDELVVPWEVMVSFLGAPDTRNYGPRRMDRKQVYEKLRVKYGAYHDDELWEQNKPQLTAWRVTGEQLITVIDDPDGLSITPSQISQQAQLATDAQIAMLNQQLQATQQLVMQLTGQAQSAKVNGEAGDQTQAQTPLSDAPLASDWQPQMVEPMGQGEGSTVAGAPPLRQHPIPAVTPSGSVPQQPPQQPPAPLPNMTPQMQPQPGVSFIDDAGNNNDNQGAGQGATQDLPTNRIKIG